MTIEREISLTRSLCFSPERTQRERERERERERRRKGEAAPERSSKKGKEEKEKKERKEGRKEAGKNPTELLDPFHGLIDHDGDHSQGRTKILSRGTYPYCVCRRGTLAKCECPRCRCRRWALWGRGRRGAKSRLRSRSERRTEAKKN